jgi:chemotaxis protein methyltransferase CheR
MSAEREFAFSDEHFRVIAGRVHAFAGIRLPQAKREMVYARLARRLRALGIGSFDDYVRFLEFEPAEWEHCTNALTTNVTSFFREAHHFDILARHAREAAPGGPFRVWSAGCSTGEEPYSIAMCLIEAGVGDGFEVLASDLDSQVLATASEAIYPLSAVAELPEQTRRRFFLRGTGRRAGRARLRPEVAARVRFLRVNLMEEGWPVPPGLGAIFCRNVMIYFDSPTKTALIDRFIQSIKPGGFLYIGHSESFHGTHAELQLVGRTTYRRKA